MKNDVDDDESSQQQLSVASSKGSSSTKRSNSSNNSKRRHKIDNLKRKMAAESLRRSPTPNHSKGPEAVHQRLVETPYGGRGLVVRTRESQDNNSHSHSNCSKPTYTPPIHEVQLLEWNKTPAKTSHVNVRQHATMLYTADELPSVQPKVGDDVTCLFGRGTVTDILYDTNHNEDDPASHADETNVNAKETKVPLQYVVTLTSWRLANRSRVVCHFPSVQALPTGTKDANQKEKKNVSLTASGNDGLSVVRKHKLPEMDTYERVEFAQSQKVVANSQFLKQHFEVALNLYANAIESVRYVQHDSKSTNQLRADLVTLMVTCNNNAGTCCIQLGKWVEATRFARNALVLLDALYGKRGKKIHTLLVEEGMGDEKLFGEWRVKSYLLIAKSAMERSEYGEATEGLKKAHEYVSMYLLTAPSTKILTSQDKEIRKLTKACLQRKRAAKAKEKEQAMAMFGGGIAETESTTVSPPMLEDAAWKKTSHAQAAMGTEEDRFEDEPDTFEDEPDTFQDEPDTFQDEPNEEPMTIAAAAAAATTTAKANQKRVSWGVDEVKELAAVEEEYDEDDEDDNDYVPWYVDHQEALVVAGATGLVAVLSMLLRGVMKR